MENLNLSIQTTFGMKFYGVASSKLSRYRGLLKNLWMEDCTCVDLFEAHIYHSLVTRYSSVFSGFPVLTRGPCGF